MDDESGESMEEEVPLTVTINHCMLMLFLLQTDEAPTPT